MQSPLPLWLFEHWHHDTDLDACVDDPTGMCLVMQEHAGSCVEEYTSSGIYKKHIQIEVYLKFM